jgi:hypothetical protein
MKKTKHHKDNGCSKLSPLTSVESVNEQPDAFDPEASVLDYATWTIVRYATENGFTPPFRLLFSDANGTNFHESTVRLKRDILREKIVFQNSGELQFPLTCRLTDQKGRNHHIILSTEEVTSWIAATGGSSRYIRFPARMANDSPEVFSTVRQMLVDSSLKGLEPPFTVEIRDAGGELSNTAEIYADEEGEFRGGRDICNCAHLKFPLTIRLISRDGTEQTATVLRNC